MTREEFKVGDKIHLMERELYNLKIKIITSEKIPEPLREELANDVFEIEKLVKNNSVSDGVIKRKLLKDFQDNVTAIEYDYNKGQDYIDSL